MLRVIHSETENGQRWILCGRLAGAWVDEMRSCWRHAREATPRACFAVDLNDVTFIDAAGEELLREMQIAGVKFIVAGVENKHLVECMQRTPVNGGKR